MLTVSHRKPFTGVFCPIYKTNRSDWDLWLAVLGPTQDRVAAEPRADSGWGLSPRGLVCSARSAPGSLLPGVGETLPTRPDAPPEGVEPGLPVQQGPDFVSFLLPDTVCPGHRCRLLTSFPVCVDTAAQRTHWAGRAPFILNRCRRTREHLLPHRHGCACDPG